MLKKLLISGFALFAGIAAANAGNVSISNSDLATAGGTLAVTDKSGSLLAPNSGYVAAGTFSLSDDAIRTADFGSLIADFKQFGASGSVSDFAGIIIHDASSALAAGDGFVGNSIYVAISNEAVPTPTSQLAVFKSSASFEADNPVFGADAGLKDATAAQILVGNFGAGVQMDDLGGVSRASLQTVGVPEPSTGLLLLSGLGMVFFRRRR
ncbi:MAG: PEP-CTERM sorting domain-containing protein [Verrucomicrobiales bacterium]